MDVRQLSCFLAVVDHGGFTRAAEHLFVAQPSLSQTIKGLESELGVPLFHRVGRTVVLSDAGQALVGPARTVVRDLEVVRGMATDLQALRSGRLEIAAMPSPAMEPLTTLIRQFGALHPGVRVGIEAGFTPEQVMESVQRGGVELGLLGTPESFGSAAVDVLHLPGQALVLVASPRLEAFGRRRWLSLADLHGQPMIATQQGSLMRQVLDRAIGEGVEVRVAVEAAHRTSILPLVLAGVGHALLPSSWSPIAGAMGLRVLEVRPRIDLHIALISRKGRLTPAAAEFRRLALDHEVEDPSGQES